MPYLRAVRAKQRRRALKKGRQLIQVGNCQRRTEARSHDSPKEVRDGVLHPPTKALTHPYRDMVVFASRLRELTSAVVAGSGFQGGNTSPTARRAFSHCSPGRKPDAQYPPSARSRARPLPGCWKSPACDEARTNRIGSDMILNLTSGLHSSFESILLVRNASKPFSTAC